jgi:ribosomal protein L11 methylase PrmA
MKLGDTGTVEAATQILTGRVEFLEVERVIDLCLEAFAARSVLDVGTGTGLFAEGFAARGLKVAGIDANPAMVEAARRYVSQSSGRHQPRRSLIPTARLIWCSWASSCTKRMIGYKPSRKPGG